MIKILSEKIICLLLCKRLNTVTGREDKGIFGIKSIIHDKLQLSEELLQSLILIPVERREERKERGEKRIIQLFEDYFSLTAGNCELAS